jgi:hypothetical protein
MERDRNATRMVSALPLTALRLKFYRHSLYILYLVTLLNLPIQTSGGNDINQFTRE